MKVYFLLTYINYGNDFKFNLNSERGNLKHTNLETDRDKNHGALYEMETLVPINYISVFL